MNSKLTLLTITVTLALLSQVNSTAWNNWNNNIVANGGHPIDTFVIPGLPLPPQGAGFARDTVMNTTARQNQYRFFITYGSANTSIYCGPRSYLTTVPGTSLWACKRDMNVAFWGGITDINSSPYNAYCIPNTSGPLSNDLLNNLPNGLCDQATWNSVNDGHNLDCCYNDVNDPNNLADETTLFITTSLFALRNSE
jgi:hypothetical protein